MPDETATQAVAQQLATQAPRQGVVVFLDGDLGMGKTTFVRGFLRALGWTGVVKSPTYTLVEPYEWGQYRIYHFDLYRLGDPEELEFIGIRDYLTPDSLCFVEWPQRGAGVMPGADITLGFSNHSNTEDGRLLHWSAATPAGTQWAQALAESSERRAPALPNTENRIR